MLAFSWPSPEVVKRRRIGKRFPVSSAALSALAARANVPVTRLPDGPRPLPEPIRCGFRDGHVPAHTNHDRGGQRMVALAIVNSMPHGRNGASPL
jgi:hypothetical protein